MNVSAKIFTLRPFHFTFALPPTPRIIQQLKTPSLHSNPLPHRDYSTNPHHFVKMVGKTLPTRQLGKNGPQVTAMGMGLMGLSAFYGKPKPDEERMKLLDYIYDAGERHWDSADMYGDNEDLLGRLVLTTTSSTLLFYFAFGWVGKW